MNLDPQQISNFTMIGIALIAAFFAALWLGLLFWVIRDIRLRSRDPFLLILSALLIIILPMSA